MLKIALGYFLRAFWKYSRSLLIERNLGKDVSNQFEIIVINQAVGNMAKDSWTRHLDGNNVKMTDKNCPNITISNRKVRKNSKIVKKVGCLILLKSLLLDHIVL